jgi:hypothetical protein
VERRLAQRIAGEPAARARAALCAAVQSSANFKVKLSAAKALQALTDAAAAGALADQSAIQQLVLALTSPDSSAERVCQDTAAPGLSVQQESYADAWAALLCSAVGRLTPSSAADLGRRHNTPCAPLLAAVVRRAALPAYALRPPRAGSGPEERQAARDAWASLPTPLLTAVARAGAVADWARAEDEGRPALLDAAAVVAGLAHG